jgi:hypothetical protein
MYGNRSLKNMLWQFFVKCKNAWWLHKTAKRNFQLGQDLITCSSVHESCNVLQDYRFTSYNEDIKNTCFVKLRMKVVKVDHTMFCFLLEITETGLE